MWYSYKMSMLMQINAFNIPRNSKRNILSLCCVDRPTDFLQISVSSKLMKHCGLAQSTTSQSQESDWGSNSQSEDTSVNMPSPL